MWCYICSKWWIIVSWYITNVIENAACFLTEPGLAWQAALKNTKVYRSINWYWYVITNI